MDLHRILNNYLEVAKELDNDSAIQIIKELAEKHANQRYELPLIGQFSSGKSATINHLIGRDLLPTKSIETTAFATFISYSASEYATLELNDGSVERISLEDIKHLDHNKVVEMGKHIKALNIGINCDLLKSGLTFVDTPGVNTIITTHIEITERILKSAQCIIYVLAKNLTDEDALMIQTIEAQNIPILFVRTRIDDIKKTEENWKDTIHESEKNIADELGHPIHFFAISNDTSRAEFESNFEQLKNYLTKDIANNVKEVFKKAVLERLTPIRKELEKGLEIHQQNLLQSANKSIEEIEKQQSQIEGLEKNWKEKLDVQKSLTCKKTDEIKADVKQLIHTKTVSKIADFNKLVNNAEGNVEELTLLLNENLSKVSSSINADAEHLIQEGAHFICRHLGEEMKSIGTELQNIGLESDCTFDMSVARDYTERQKNIDEQFIANVEKINAIKEELSQKANLSEKYRTDIESALSQAEAEIQKYQSNVETISNSYEPQYIEKQSQLGKIGKTVGNVLDIAMLLIPAAGWIKAGTVASKIGKSGTMIGKGGKLLGKAAKVLAKTDTAKDAATLLGGLKNVNDKIKGQIKKTSIFDYLSLAYWMEKAGESFDPSTCELDQQYEREFQNRKSEAESKLQKLLDERTQQIGKLARLNGEKWKLEQEKAAAEKSHKDLIRETQILKGQLEAEKAKEVRASLISQAKQQFASRINNYTDILTRRTSNMVDVVCSSIFESANMKITNQLNSISEQLSEIINNRNTCVENKEKTLSHLTELSSKLKIEKE